MITSQPIRLVRDYFIHKDRPPIAAVRYLVNGDIEAHSHELMEIAIVGKGQGAHITAHGQHVFSEGEVFIFRPGAWHAFVGCCELDVFNCYFGPELLSQELAWLHEEPAFNYLFWKGPMSLKHQGILSLKLVPSDLAVCQEYLTKLQRLHEQSALTHARTDLIGLLLLLFGQIARGLDEQRSQPISIVHKSVLHALHLMEEQPSFSWTLDQLAECTHLNRSYLVRLFKFHTGLSPMTYLARYRMECAARLLISSNDAITEIARRVGWGDPSYFARRFKALLGMSPTQYRATLRAPSSYRV